MSKTVKSFPLTSSPRPEEPVKRPLPPLEKPKNE